MIISLLVTPCSGAGAGAPKGSSADTFYPSWAADGNLYTPFTDGSVVDDVTGKAYRAQSEGGGPGGGHVTHGQAAIVGDDPFGLSITKVRTMMLLLLRSCQSFLLLLIMLLLLPPLLLLITLLIMLLMLT